LNTDRDNELYVNIYCFTLSNVLYTSLLYTIFSRST